MFLKIIMFAFLKRLFGGSSGKVDVSGADAKVLARRILLGQAREPRRRMLQLANGAGQAAIDTIKEAPHLLPALPAGLDLNLNFSAESLFAIDYILNAFHNEGQTEESIPVVILGYGWYVGEVIIRNDGGRWRAASEVNVPTPPPGWGICGKKKCASLVVELPNKTICDPMGAALQLVKGGFNPLKGELDNAITKLHLTIRLSIACLRNGGSLPPAT